jgi:ferric-dicitrate binding protein FerR (iron transport regulator)
MVRLEGEGFFEIARNENSPFLVNAGDEAVVRVLGTSFNLRTDPENKKVFLNVLSGKVAFYPKGKKKEAGIIGRDEHAVCEKGAIVQDLNLDLNFLSWKTNILEFDNTPLPEVVEQLGRHYATEFSLIDAGLDTLALTGTYKQQSMEEVLDEISILLEIDFSEVDGNILVRH